MHTLNFRTPNKLDESPHKVTKTDKPAAEDEGESHEDNYGVIEMQVTSSAKTRYAPAQTIQKGTITYPTEAKKDSAANKENEEDENGYINVIR